MHKNEFETGVWEIICAQHRFIFSRIKIFSYIKKAIFYSYERRVQDRIIKKTPHFYLKCCIYLSLMLVRCPLQFPPGILICTEEKINKNIRFLFNNT